MAQYLPHSVVPNRWSAVTPSDTTLLPGTAISLYVGGAGAVVVDTRGGDTNISFAAVPAGMTLVGRFKRVKAATGATNILVGWFED